MCVCVCGSSTRAEVRFAFCSLNPQPDCVNYLNELKKETYCKLAVFFHDLCI